MLPVKQSDEANQFCNLHKKATTKAIVNQSNQAFTFRPNQRNCHYILTLITIFTLIKPTICTLNRVLDFNQTFSYLVDPRSGKITPPSEYIDFDNIYAPNETYKRQVTAQSRNYHLIKAFDFANYYQSDYWHYSDHEELKISAEPIANETLCKQQVDWLLEQLGGPRGEEILFDRGEEHLNFMSLIDSYGKPDPATFSGHNIWLGSYDECKRVSINISRFEHESCLNQFDDCQKKTITANGKDDTVIKYRYCMAKARDKDWPTDDRYKPTITYKIGLCLPETCQTSSIGQLQRQFESLMKVNLPIFWKNRLNLTEIYCLPDERSPLRKLSPSGYILLSFMIIWVSGLLVATLVYSCHKRNEEQLKSLLCQTITTTSVNEAAISPELDTLTSGGLDQQICNGNMQAPSTITTTTFISKKNASSMSTETINNWIKESPMIIKILGAISITENIYKFREPPPKLRKSDSSSNMRINLNPLDCIKCFCCIFVICGHIVFIHMQHMSNITHTIEISNQLGPRLLISLFNFVDTFFIISGMLTSYFIFQRFNVKTFSNPITWFFISLTRFLRLSPVYILVFWFVKTLSIYLSEGPLWDYGTDKNSIKGLCRNDHWWKSILYIGNWGTMQPLCILPAWSIIVDSQYSLIMPPIIFLLMKYRKSGYIMMFIAIFTSTLQMSWQLASQEAVKASDMAQVRLHVYPLISRFAAEFYNTAFNRIGPVAIGIFGGYALYLYEIGKIRSWPNYMRGLGFKLILFMHLFIICLPTLGKLMESPTGPEVKANNEDITLFILSNATIKPIWSIVNTILILRLITDLRQHSIIAKLMSHNLWHCLGRLCFVSYLIHYEIIILLLKSRRDNLLDANWLNAARESSFVFILSTGISYCVYIIFESPANNLLMLMMSKFAKKRPAKNEPDKNDLREITHINSDDNCINGNTKTNTSISLSNGK